MVSKVKQDHTTISKQKNIPQTKKKRKQHRTTFKQTKTKPRYIKKYQTKQAKKESKEGNTNTKKSNITI